jgi:4'-phosphopantetheinyl transferase
MIFVDMCKMDNDNRANFIFSEQLAQLPDAMQTEIRKYKREEDQIRGLIGKLLLRKALTSIGFATNVLERVSKDIFNRPMLLDASIDFNIAHSEDWIIVTFAQTNRVGVDVEKLNHIELDNLGFWYNQIELKKLSNHQNPVNFFYTTWTQKEATVKAIGEGLAIPFAEIFIENFVATYKKKAWVLYPLDVGDGYIAHLAAEKKQEIVITEKRLEEIVC